MDKPEALRVTVVFSPALRQVFERELLMPEGATVQDGLDASGLAHIFPDMVLGELPVGIWRVGATRTTPLRDGDRIEMYRPLKVDPKEARRTRFQKQGAKSAGLFTQLRKGAKQGY